ncbi:hypothetical protein ACFL4E_00610 [Candidatus Omnitrophota bacterium]
MITKERLLAGLHELVYVEEGMIGMFTGFAKALVQHTEDMEEEKKKDINKMLSLLQNDSAKHKKMIEELTREIEESKKHEY